MVIGSTTAPPRILAQSPRTWGVFYVYVFIKVGVVLYTLKNLVARVCPRIFFHDLCALLDEMVTVGNGSGKNLLCPSMRGGGT